MTVTVATIPQTSAISVGMNEAGQLVEDKFTSAQAYADSSITDAQYYINTLVNLFGTITVPTVDIDYAFQDVTITSNLESLRPAAPSDALLTPNPVAEPARPLFSAVSTDINITTITKPTFVDVDTNVPLVNITKPVVTDANSISSVSVSTPDLESVPDEVIAPTVPRPGLYPSNDISMPELDRPAFIPVPTDISIPTAEKPTGFGTVTVPTVTIPKYDIIEPDTNFNHSEDNYNSELNIAIIATVKNVIENGGTGLGEEVEDALWERARDRTVLENERMYSETEDYFASRGYEIPPGMLSGRLLEITKEINRNNQQLNYEISIEQARLAKEHTQFAITSAIQLEGQDKELFNASTARLLEASKTAAEIILRTYETKVAAYGSRVQAAGTEANVAKITADVVIQSNANLISIYQNEIVAIGHEIEVIKAKISAAVENNNSLVSIYEADIKVAALEADSEKITAEMISLRNNNLIDIYGKDITAAGLSLEAVKIGSDNNLRYNDNLISNYSNDINAANLQITADKANADIILQENINLTNIYSSDIQATGLEIEASKIEIDGKIKNNANLVNIYQGDIAFTALEVDVAKAKIAAVIEGNKSLSDLYATDIEAYKAKVAVELSIIENIAKIYSYKVAGYEADAKATAVALDAQIEEYKARISQANNQTTLSLKEAELVLQGYLGAIGLTVEGQKSMANISAQLAASAMSSVNASASLGDSLARGMNIGYSHNENLANSLQLSENHQYPHKES